MAEIVNINMNDGTLDAFDSIVASGGTTVSAEVAAALAGSSYGMQIGLANVVSSAYGIKNISYTSDSLRLRFYIDLTNVTLTNGNLFYLLYLDGTDGPVVMVAFYKSASGVGINAYHVTDSGSFSLGQVGPFYDLASGEHLIEVLATRATSNVAADGSVELWVDEVSQGSRSDIDVYDRARANSLDFGGKALDIGTDGNAYVDELIIRNDAIEIGPVVLGNPAYYYEQMRQRRKS